MGRRSKRKKLLLRKANKGIELDPLEASRVGLQRIVDEQQKAKQEAERKRLEEEKKKLKFISTPLDIQSAQFLGRFVDYFKIASGDNDYYELMETVFKFKKPTIISTGLLKEREIGKLVNFVKKKNLN